MYLFFKITRRPVRCRNLWDARCLFTREFSLSLSPTTYYLLPPIYSLLPTTSSLPPTSFSLLPPTDDDIPPYRPISDSSSPSYSTFVPLINLSRRYSAQTAGCQQANVDSSHTITTISSSVTEKIARCIVEEHFSLQ